MPRNRLTNTLAAAGTVAAALTAIATAATTTGLGLREWLLRRSLPPRRERLAIPGLGAAVEVLIDRWGVPHIYASTLEDVYFAQGYVHARDRQWQMELNRRLARGELAEVLGKEALDTDRFLRRLGLRHLAEEDLAHVGQEDRANLEAYAAGANAYAQRHPSPIELTLLRLRWRLWTPVDSLAYGRFMAFTQTWNWESEYARARLINAVGPEQAAEMEAGRVAAGVPEHDTPVPEPTAEAARRFGALVPGVGGSNNWVVAPFRSITGSALLANDPHLSPQLPGAWYVAHLSAGDTDVEGASLPGVPGIVIGHNQRIAWGITSGITDTADLFVERQAGEEAGRAARAFEFRGEPEQAEVRVETIEVKGHPPHEEPVVVTRHGPLLNGVLGIPEDGPPIALACAVLKLPPSVRSLKALNLAATWNEFQVALEDWYHPCLNFVYADVDGNIGYKLAGRVPMRKAGDGYAPVAGWDGAHEWTGWVPFEEMPEIYNPPEGIFATANTRPDTPSKHVPTRDWIDDSRWRRIMQLLRSREQHSLDDMAVIQGDQTTLPGREIMAMLAPIAVEGDLARQALDMVTRWDGRLSAASAEGAIYWSFRRELLHASYSHLEPAPFAVLDGRGLHVELQQSNAFGYKGSSIMAARVDELMKTEQGRDQLAGAFEAAVKRLAGQQGNDPKAWEWGRLHRVPWRHPIGHAVPTLDRVLNLSRGPFPIGGDGDTPNQTGIHPWRDFEASGAIASYRQLYDLADWDRARFVIPPGQSGHPRSPHYDDLLEAWRRTAYRPLLYARATIEEATTETIHLTPV